ncbi:MAG: 2-C-methyl-D-erythritol 4-phosphate cytidylyltransferase [Candidatus Eremiobacteraeota bacterium]|nr:2-C-methyl-D-erythritol 4-phosphate cytidylyltransferase [Candidatus Eremiobacteraeota bacterium]
MLWCAVIVAAGTGSRFGRPKQLLEIAGAPMVSWSIHTFARMPEIADIVVVTETDLLGPVQSIASQAAGEKCAAVVSGGATRQESVYAGICQAPERSRGILVHDGARPLVRANDVREGMRLVRDGVAAVLAAPVVDTIKEVDRTTKAIRRTLDRTLLWAAQTPQLATARDLLRAHNEARHDGVAATDDAMLLERSAVDVFAVESSPENFKVTIPEDMIRADHLMRRRVEHAPNEEEVLFVEVFADEALADALCTEFERRGGTVDGVDRDLPSGVAVRAYIASQAFAGFGQRFESIQTGDATFTTRFSHWAERT